MYIDDLVDWLKLILSCVYIILVIAFLSFAFFITYKESKQKHEIDSVKNKLEIENLELENKLLILQLKEYGFDFTEESEQIVED